MKVTLLMENTSLFTKYLNVEHGFSAWIEDEDIKILYDFGFSDKFIKNAQDLGIDLRTVDYIVLSHCHRDHSGGLKYLLKYFDENAMYRKPVFLIAEEGIFAKRYNFTKNHASGFDVPREVIEKYFTLKVSEIPVQLTKNLWFMGKTHMVNNFEHITPQVAKKQWKGEWIEDVVDEDTQLCYLHKDGHEVSVVAACAHYGICNIMEYAKEITGGHHIDTYLGGSHLRIDEVSQLQLDKTCDYVSQQHINNFYICHDTDQHCKLALWNATPSKEAGVGLVLEIDHK